MIRRPPRCTRTDTLFPYTTRFRSYGHLKLSAVIDGLGNIVDRLVPPEGPVHVINRRIAMWTEARARGLDRISGKKGAGASSEAIEFFRPPDPGFRTRRLRLPARQLAASVPATPAHRHPVSQPLTAHYIPPPP